MSSRRAPAPPPDIEGYAYVSVIGSGGFSDVYCYQQNRPRRRVAVKVLLQEWSSQTQREAFDAEADLLATLSTHPSIVTMYEADVADDGRPYMAMEYCSRPSLGARYRTERLGVPEALRTAVLIAGAVETAHRAGILHRDIKPANLLVTDYGHPVLTDFGISATVDQAGLAEGMSIPWSPPESFAEQPTSGVATDVWALAATTYSLLAGRSPFEVPGGRNTSADLVGRIEGTPLPPLGRSDVPPSLERVLATAMAKSPQARYPSALALARALQAVQTELSLAVTPIDLLDDSGVVQEPDDDEDEAGTRLRQVVTIDPHAPSPSFAPGAPAAPAPARAAAPEPAYDAVADEHLESTVHRPADAPAVPGEGPGHGSRVALLVGAAVVVAAAVVALVVLPGSSQAPDDAGTGSSAAADDGSGTDGDAQAPADNLGDLVPSVSALSGKAAGDGTVRFTWKNPDPQKGDEYAVTVLEKVDQKAPELVDDTATTVPADPSGSTCVAVSVVRDGRMSAEQEQACVEEKA
ncbi:serine/threonine-protein kinase [Cellulomonas sp. PhB143]|uniref:serine/threonine-protein kinase n=1 Tax=Cellulomonas sp. PhB143 TaxID=2485186 RepID=UPI000F475CB1|nr:serine/threonine-protein kinase [Cellulomonas sp. PhB143]ROS76730.1 serine/threonine protein kinase [Cellulomonas sp. PhB143]